VHPGLIQPSIKDPNLTDAAALTRMLRDLGRRVGCRGWVRVALPDPVFLLRTITTDALPPDRNAARRFLGWQARDLLPFPPDQARLDYVSAGAGHDGRLRLTCLIGNDRILAEYERLLHEADFLPAVLDARSVVLAQAAAASLTFQTVGILTADGPRVTLLVIEQGRPRLWRILTVDSMADGNGVRLIREVADSLAYFREAEDVGPLERLFVHGMADRTAALASELTRWLELPVGILDLAGLQATGTWPQGLANELSRWGTALGAAIRPW
jgi:Tfp pilus assembly PilM family ATPase